MNCPCPQMDIEKYRDKPFEQTPCAICPLSKQPTKVNKHIQLYDTDGAVDFNFPQQASEPAPLDLSKLSKDGKISSQTVNLIVQAVEQNFLVVLSNIVLKLTNLAKTYPVLYNILHLKMQHPELSYYEIGQAQNPPCSKQMVLHHLSHAVRQFPELDKAIFVDSRFSGGHYAIRRMADMVRRYKQIEKVRKYIYQETEANSRKDFKALVRELEKPYKIKVIKSFQSYEPEKSA